MMRKVPEGRCVPLGGMMMSWLRARPRRWTKARPCQTLMVQEPESATIRLVAGDRPPCHCVRIRRYRNGSPVQRFCLSSEQSRAHSVLFPRVRYPTRRAGPAPWPPPAPRPCPPGRRTARPCPDAPGGRARHSLRPSALPARSAGTSVPVAVFTSRRALPSVSARPCSPSVARTVRKPSTSMSTTSTVMNGRRRRTCARISRTASKPS